MLWQRYCGRPSGEGNGVIAASTGGGGVRMAYRLAAGEPVGGRVALAGPTEDDSSAWSARCFIWAGGSREHTCVVPGAVRGVGVAFLAIV
jgi:hypothetical protein